MLKLTRFHFLKNNNLAAQVKHEKIKQIFKKKSVFDALSFKLCTIRKMLQETNHFAQKIYVKTIIDGIFIKK